MGRALVENFLDTVRRHPEYARTIIESTLKDMVRAGRLSGGEIAFLRRLAEALAVRAAPKLTVTIPARITEPDGSTAIYQSE